MLFIGASVLQPGAEIQVNEAVSQITVKYQYL